MGGNCSCVEDKACYCKSNVTECLQRSAQNRRDRRCNCTSRRPTCLRIRRKCACDTRKKKVSFSNCTCQLDCPQATVCCTNTSDEDSYCSNPSPTANSCTETIEIPDSPAGKPGTVKNVCRFTVDAYFA